MVELVVCSSTATEHMQTIYGSKSLGIGAHTIEVKSLIDFSEKESAMVTVDAFDVLPRLAPSR